MVETFIENEGCPIAEVALSHLFRVHPEMKRASERISMGEADKVPETVRRTLRKYGVINDKNQFAGSMIRKAFNSITQLSEIGANSNDVNQSSTLDSLGEWAEDLAALGQRRNLIERKLRGIVLNFLRMSAMQNRKLEKLGEQVINALPETRRKLLIGLPLDSLFQRLMWPELVNLVAGNWQLFEAIFGDRRLFEEHAAIVNDRPDAHAKEWDQADFALYRRSLQWLEERLAKLH